MSNFRPIPRELGVISKWDTDCRWVEPSKCCGVMFDRAAGMTLDSDQQSLTVSEIRSLAQMLVEYPRATGVVLYRDANSVLASVYLTDSDEWEITWDLTNNEEF